MGTFAADFKLAPAASGSRVTLNITAADQPYIDEWHADVRRSPAETLAETVLRVIVNQALLNREGKLVSDVETGASDAKTTEQEQIRSDRTEEETRAVAPVAIG